MKKIERDGELPHSCAALFNALTDYSRFPRVFPVIKAATVLAQGPDFADVEMVFNLTPKVAAQLGRDSETVHITWTPDRKEINIASTGGLLKKMDIRWTFNEVAANKTQVKFLLEYDTGMNFVKNMVIHSHVKDGTKDIIGKLGEFTTQREAEGPGAP